MLIAMVSMHTSPDERPGRQDAGGMNVVVLETAKALADLGHRVDIYTRSAGAAHSRSLHPGVTLYAVATPGGIVRKGDLPLLADDFGEALQRAALRAEPGYDIIHAHYWLSGLAALPVALALDVPLVQSFHTLAVTKNQRLAPGDHPEPERRVLTERYLALEADALVAVSTAEADALIDDVGAAPTEVWLVPPGVDADTFRPAPLDVRDDVRARLGVGIDEALLAVVGRIQPLKDQLLAVEMLAHVPDAVLALVGEPTPGDHGYLESIHARAAELGVADRLRAIGSLDRDALARLIGASSLVVVPSRTESFGMVPLEAAACGTPVVAARVGGLVESVREGVSGVLVDARDPAEWAGACRMLLDDAGMLLTMSATARQWATSQSWQRAARALERVYGELT